MFPLQDTPRRTELGGLSTRGWEAVDRVDGRPAQASAESSAGNARRWRALAACALGHARAFIMLDESPVGPARASRPRDRAETPAHPHRQPVRPVHRARRPGAGAPRHHHCLTPIQPNRSSGLPGGPMR
ncbi:MAG: hypothetical protein U0S48_12855 [Solirubrobacteraceae bacterium]